MSEQLLEAFREDAVHAVAPIDFSVIERHGARRRLRHRATGAIAVAAVLASVGSLTLLDDTSAPSPGPASEPGFTGYPLVEEGADGRIPPGRSELPALTRGTPAAAVTVAIPDGTRGWGQNLDQSGVYSRNRYTPTYLHLAAYVVDGVVERPCRQSFIPPTGPVPDYADPGPSMNDLATAIADMPRGKVLSPPRTVEKWGITAIHLRIQLRHTACLNGNRLYMFDTATGAESIGNLQAVMDFWVVMVNGQRVVIEAEAPMSAARGERRALARLAGSVQLHSLS